MTDEDAPPPEPETAEEPGAPAAQRPADEGRAPARTTAPAAEAEAPPREFRILAFADLHLDRAFPWAGVEGAQELRMRQVQTLEAICSTAAAEADALLCAGDLYDESRHHPDTGELLHASFERLHPLPVLIAPGNNDPAGRASLYARVSWPENVHVFGDAEPTPFELAPGIMVWGSAGPLDGDAQAQARQAAGERATAAAAAVHLGLCHGAPTGAPALTHLIAAAGHEPSGDQAVTCPGVPLPLLPEDPLGSVLLISVGEDGSVAVHRRELGATRPQEPPPMHPTGALDEFDLATLGQEQTVRGEFVRDMLAAEGGAELRRLALLLGLNALAGTPPE